MCAAVLARLVEKPISLSYHAATESSVPSCTAVNGRSMIDECGSPTMRDEFYSSSSAPSMPLSGAVSAALRNAALTSSTVTGRSVTRLSSTMLPVRTGTLSVLKTAIGE